MDIGVRYGKGVYPGLSVDKLADDALVVVVAPDLRARKKLTIPGDLRRHVLLHDDARESWAHWLAENGVQDVDPHRGTVLVDSSMLVEAAVRGQGVGLARWSLAMDDLASGRLVLPFPTIRPTPTGLSYYVALPREALARPEVAAFRAWLLREAKGLVIGRAAKRPAASRRPSNR